MVMVSRPNDEVISINPTRDFDWSSEQINLLQQLTRLDPDAASYLAKIHSTEDLSKFHKKPEYLTPKQVQAMLLQQSNHLYTIFNKQAADSLPEHSPHDFEIKLKPNSKLPFKRPYDVSREELTAVKKYIDENLHNFIHLTMDHIVDLPPSE